MMDPFYADQTGNMIAQIGQDLSQKIMQIPVMLRQNEVWKNEKKTAKSEVEFKNRLRSAAMGSLQKIGVDPSSLMIPDPSNQKISSEDYAQKIAELMAPHFFGSSQKLGTQDASTLGISENPAVKENLARQSFVSQYDLPTTSQQPEEEISPMLKDAMAGLPGGMPEVQKQEKNYFDPLAEETVKQVRGGMISAEKAFERMSRIKELELKERLEDKRTEREEKRRKEEQFAGGVMGAGDTNEIIDPKTGEPVTVTRENVLNVGIGQRKYPPKSGGRGGTGDGESADKLKEQKEAWDQYNDVERQRLAMVKGRDEAGNAVPFDQESFNQKTTESAIRLLSYDLTADGSELGASNAAAIRTIDAPMVISGERASDPMVDLGNGRWALNIANKKIRTALLLAAKQGASASEILSELRMKKGLNPAKIK